MGKRIRRFPAIHEAIKERGDVKTFAAEAGIHENTYYRMQHGTTDPSLFTINAILDYTGLTFEQAFREK